MNESGLCVDTLNLDNFKPVTWKIQHKNTREGTRQDSETLLKIAAI